MKTSQTSETCAQTAKRVRAALKIAYPDVKFSVRSSTYSGGASINVYFTDGPAEREVGTLLRQFAGADFDGMTDMKTYRDDVLVANADGTYEQISSGADYVSASRTISQAWRDAVAAEIAAVTGLPCDLTSRGDGWNARYDAYVIDGVVEAAGDHPQAYGGDLFREATSGPAPDFAAVTT